MKSHAYLGLVAAVLLIGIGILLAPTKKHTPRAVTTTPDSSGAPLWCRVGDKLRHGETLYDLLLRHKVDARTVVEVGAAMSQVVPPRKLWPGERFVLFFDPDESLAALELRRSPMERYRLERHGAEFSIARIPVDVDTVYRGVWGEVRSNLWNAFSEADAPPELIVAFTDVFAWTVDFFREVRPGDAFGAWFSQLSVEGKTVETGPLAAAYYVRGADTMWAFGFPENDELKYFDREGNSLQKALLRAPLKYSRVSSKFSKRRLHPVQKVYRPHNGTDYAAPAGTPIYAAGDGQVRFVGRKNGLGKCVELRHPNGYTTVYGHMMKFAKGLHSGEAVRQRQVIGYVGMTGNASGHHLHYEVRQGRKPINPQTLKLPAKGPVPKALRAEFEQQRDSLWQLLIPVYGPPLAMTP